jgi:hypothetical protein
VWHNQIELCSCTLRLCCVRCDKHQSGLCSIEKFGGHRQKLQRCAVVGWVGLKTDCNHFRRRTCNRRVCGAAASGRMENRTQWKYATHAVVLISLEALLCFPFSSFLLLSSQYVVRWWRLRDCGAANEPTKAIDNNPPVWLCAK